jgi:hypothetical protein
MAHCFEGEMVVVLPVHAFFHDLEAGAALAGWQQRMHVAADLPAPTY